MAGVVVVCLTLCSGYLRFFEDTGLNTVMLQNHNYLAIKHLWPSMEFRNLAQEP